MKKIIIYILTLLISISISSANYTPNPEDEKLITTLEQQVQQLSENPKDIRNFFYQFKTLRDKFKDNPQLFYILWELANSSHKNLEEKKQEAKKLSKEKKQKLINTYIDKLTLSEKLTNNCKKYYDLIDDISFAHNFPTSAVISTWYRESSCGFSLPSNGDGPFQIVTKDYGTGTMTEELFVQTVLDFIQFTENKIKRYNGKIKTKLDYQHIDLESFINFSALYNWGKVLNGIIAPYHPQYIFDGYQWKYSNAKRYGTRPYLIKVLNRELENHY